MTVSQAFIRYDIERLQLKNKAMKTRRNYRTALNSFLKYSDNVDVEVEDLTYDHLTNWTIELVQSGLEPSYIASNLSRWREVISYLRLKGYDVIDPIGIERPSVKQKPPTWLDIDEVRRFLSVIENPRDKAIFACYFGSGARLSELLNLNRDSIQDGIAQTIGKGDKIGMLVFDDYALQCLDEYMITRTDTLRPLFISAQRSRLSGSRVQQLAHEYADKARIDKRVTPHVFRHSFASDLKFNGADIYDIKEQLRHSNIGTTQMYVHISDDKKIADHRRFHSAVALM